MSPNNENLDRALEGMYTATSPEEIARLVFLAGLLVAEEDCACAREGDSAVCGLEVAGMQRRFLEALEDTMRNYCPRIGAEGAQG